MGKVRKLRQKYHLSKVGKPAKEDEQKNDHSGNEKFSGVPFPSTENIFAGLDITYDSLTKSLPGDFDVRSVVSTKSRKEMKLEEQHLKKKVKMKLRRERFLQKLDVAQQVMKAEKEKKKKNKKGRKKKTIFNEPNPLIEALPSLKSLLTDNSRKGNEEKEVSKPRGIMKMKKRIKQQTTDAKLMKKILKDKKFKSNPGQTITEYLKQKVAMER